jgi:magnesium chelatase subunit H
MASDGPRCVEALVAGDAGARLHAAAAADSARRPSSCCANWPADALLAQDHEIGGILHALDGRFVRPAPGRRPAAHAGHPAHRPQPARLRPVPHPQRLRGARTARARPSGCCSATLADGNAFPRSVAMVLWGTDNLKSEGGPIAQALALIGAARASTATAAWPAPS